MIPKIVHYCWFGNQAIPKQFQEYINHWKELLPDYKFIEWNEENYDWTKLKYTREAMQEKKYAFVSDLARIDALIEYGGFYLDTDIELCKNLDDLLNYRLVLGYENGGHAATAFIGSEPNNPVLIKFRELYKDIPFIREDGSYDLMANTYRLAEMMKEYGLKCNDSFQEFQDGMVIFPTEYFCAMSVVTLTECRTQNTYAIHHYTGSWKPLHKRLRKKLKVMIVKLIGDERFKQLKAMKLWK